MVEGEASTSGDNFSLCCSASPCSTFLLAPETFALLSSLKTLKFFLNSKALHMPSPVPDMFFSIVLVVDLMPLGYKFIHFACFVNIYIYIHRLLLCPWDSPGKNTGMGCHFLLQGIFTQGSIPCLLTSPALVVGFFTTSATWEAHIYICVYIHMLVAQSCLTLCNPMDCSPPGSSVHEIFQARILEWVAISFSRGIFPTQGSNPGFLHCMQILLQLSYNGSHI